DCRVRSPSTTGAAAGRHDCADDVDHRAGERRDGVGDDNRHRHGLGQRRRDEGRVLPRRRAAEHRHDVTVQLELGHDRQRQRPALADVEAYDAALNVGISVTVSVTVSNGVPVDVSGWTLTQANATQTYTIPAGTVIPSHGYL